MQAKGMTMLIATMCAKWMSRRPHALMPTQHAIMKHQVARAS